MNRTRRALAATLAVLGAASAERIPVLAEPRSASGGGISFDAWGDTLVSARWGTSWRLVRRADEVAILDSLSSDSLRSEMPRTFPTLYGTNLQISEKWLTAIDWGRHTVTTSLVGGFNLGYSRTEGGIFRVGDTLVALLCSPSNQSAYTFTKFGPEPWQLKDSLHVSSDSLQTCSVDTANDYSIRHVRARGGNKTGFMNLGYNSEALHKYSSIPVRYGASTVFAGDPQSRWSWLAYEDSTGRVHLGGVDVDSVLQPPELANLADTYVKPVRRDSLVVFGGDSTLVLAKWVANRFSILQTIHLDSPLSYPMALGDSTLWIGTRNRILSFRVRWAERSVGVGERLTVRASTPAPMSYAGGQLRITWNESNGTELLVTRIDGTVVAQGRIQAGETASFAIPTSRNLLLVRTTQGTRRIMTR